MAFDHHLEFLRHKIMNIRNALCTLHHPAFHQPVQIIHPERIDSEGNILFRFERHSQDKLSLINKPFDVDFIFYRKGMPYYLKINAQATLDASDGNWSRYLVKAKIGKAEYAESRWLGKRTNFFSQMRTKIASLAASIFIW